MKSSRYRSSALVNILLNTRLGKNVILGCLLLLVWVFQKLLISWDLHTLQNRVNSHRVSRRPAGGETLLREIRGMRRMIRLVQADRKATVTLMTVLYSRGDLRINNMLNLKADWLKHRIQKHTRFHSRHPRSLRIQWMQELGSWRAGTMSPGLFFFGPVSVSLCILVLQTQKSCNLHILILC